MKLHVHYHGGTRILSGTQIQGNGNEQEELLELTNKYLEVTDETIRSKTAELPATNMTDGQDPDKHFLRATLLRGQVERVGEHIMDRRFEDTMEQVWSRTTER